MRCDKCLFWSVELSNEKNEPWIGACHRYPPTEKQDGEIYTSVAGRDYMRVSKFEIITKNCDFCGEYKRKVS